MLQGAKEVELYGKLREGVFDCSESPNVKLDLDAAVQRIRAGEHAMHPMFFTLDSKHLRMCFKKAYEVILKDKGAFLSQDLIAQSLEDEFFLTRKAISLVVGNLGQEIHSEEGRCLFFLLWVAILPQLIYIKEIMAPHVKDWENGVCPVCGNLPGIGIIRDPGLLTLYCSVCYQAWRYPRLKCPFCANEDQSSLGYLQVEGTAHRIYYCEKCLGYLKTVDERELEGEVVPEKEFITTIYLDIIARERGFEIPNRPGITGND